MGGSLTTSFISNSRSGSVLSSGTFWKYTVSFSLEEIRRWYVTSEVTEASFFSRSGSVTNWSAHSSTGVRTRPSGSSRQQSCWQAVF